VQLHIVLVEELLKSEEGEQVPRKGFQRVEDHYADLVVLDAFEESLKSLSSPEKQKISP
jgi:hypothetical protein